MKCGLYFAAYFGPCTEKWCHNPFQEDCAGADGLDGFAAIMPSQGLKSANISILQPKIGLIYGLELF